MLNYYRDLYLNESKENMHSISFYVLMVQALYQATLTDIIATDVICKKTKYACIEFIVLRIIEY